MSILKAGVAALVIGMYLGDDALAGETHRFRFSKTNAAERAIRTAERMERPGGWESAILLYEEILLVYPNNKKVLSSLIRCHESLLKEELKEITAPSNEKFATPVFGPRLPELPELWPLVDPPLPDLVPLARPASLPSFALTAPKL
jgi:hypothetical protein